MDTRRNDEEFVSIIRRFRPALIAFFLRRLGDHSEAEDMAQEVLARLATNRSEQMRNPDAYVFQMAANLLRDRSRRERVRHNYRLGIGAADLADVELLAPDRILTGRETLDKVKSILRELPERTRNIFILYRLEGMRKRDIATNYGISVSAVDKHLMKAMATMLDRLGEDREGRSR